MNEREIAEQNTILLIRSGSHLYGTNTPESDEDYLGISIFPKEYYIGLNQCKEVDCSLVSKDLDGKNNKDAIDKKLYEIRNYVELCRQGNPNIIEILMVNDENIMCINSFGRKLLANAHLFPSKLVKQRFIGYAISQMKKATVKPDNFKDLEFFKQNYDPNVDDRRIVEMQYLSYGFCRLITFYNDHATVGGLNFNLNVKMRKVYDAVITRLGKASHRQDMWLKYGCDVKFLMHCVRLMMEGKELLETGRIQFPLKEKDLLLDIRNGKLSLEQIHQLVAERKDDLETFDGNLPATPNFDLINKFLIETVEEFWSCK